MRRRREAAVASARPSGVDVGAIAECALQMRLRSPLGRSSHDLSMHLQRRILSTQLPLERGHGDSAALPQVLLPRAHLAQPNREILSRRCVFAVLGHAC